MWRKRLASTRDGSAPAQDARAADGVMIAVRAGTVSIRHRQAVSLYRGGADGEVARVVPSTITHEARRRILPRGYQDEEKMRGGLLLGLISQVPA